MFCEHSWNVNACMQPATYDVPHAKSLAEVDAIEHYDYRNRMERAASWCRSYSHSFGGQVFRGIFMMYLSIRVCRVFGEGIAPYERRVFLRECTSPRPQSVSAIFRNDHNLKQSDCTPFLATDNVKEAHIRLWFASVFEVANLLLATRVINRPRAL